MHLATRRVLSTASMEAGIADEIILCVITLYLCRRLDVKTRVRVHISPLSDKGLAVGRPGRAGYLRFVIYSI